MHMKATMVNELKNDGIDGENTVKIDTRKVRVDPSINVISKEEFEDQVEKVFYLLWETLSRSFGPYGAPTIIYNFPWSHVTKDGYTIMKNLSMNTSETLLHEAIKGMAEDICGRLNYTVGDGTTSAIIATYSLYKHYMHCREALNAQMILPRDVLFRYEKLKEEIIELLREKVTPIQTTDREQLRQNIHDIVFISSNGDEAITKMIEDLYYELGAPAISCVLAPDGITKKLVVTGYKYDLTINDPLYINNDDKTCEIKDCDVIIFGTKITRSTYEHILKPLNIESKRRNRRLLVAAPAWDDTAVKQVISVDLNNEYRQTHKINMILTTYRSVSTHTRKLISDFAMLCNTQVIDRVLEEEITNKIVSGKSVLEVFDMDTRNINGLCCLAVGSPKQDENGNSTHSDFILYNKEVDELPTGYEPINNYIKLDDDYVQLGFIREGSLGLKTSQFTGFCYDEEKYNRVLKEAERELEEAKEKYKKLGTFNIEVTQCQQRLYSLQLKMGIIEVGADSELSQKMLKDAVDDAIRAAASAYDHGIILGCNVNLIQSIQELIMKKEEIFPSSHEGMNIETLLLVILRDGFKDVYRTVLSNAFDDIPSLEQELHEDTTEDNIKFFLSILPVSHITSLEDLGITKDDFQKTVDICLGRRTVSLQDFLIELSLQTGKVLDISTFRYTDKVVNSTQTDEEILKATIDLISLLITGNQMVITQRNNFD